MERNYGTIYHGLWTNGQLTHGQKFTLEKNKIAYYTEITPCSGFTALKTWDNDKDQLDTEDYSTDFVLFIGHETTDNKFKIKSTFYAKNLEIDKNAWISETTSSDTNEPHFL